MQYRSNPFGIVCFSVLEGRQRALIYRHQDASKSFIIGPDNRLPVYPLIKPTINHRQPTQTDSSSWPPQTLLHPDTVSLGRLTTNANRPPPPTTSPTPPPGSATPAATPPRASGCKRRSSRKVQNMALEEGNRWKTVWDWRGAKRFESDEDDVFEAELTDFSDFEDDGEGMEVGGGTDGRGGRQLMGR
ncbi:uncharacterized protein H6S33_008583 [Morchella sextelata]|uniref:uncharacterized protein n=1 Tax=Morchella sextelata TaxID=1174677 RepID=UPI001D059D71|nr:uncharacterized protein H6S33_008583 [Morchella sextelata]KAH0602502.1 hypothetical protein H6S33_008583 [Morchella sextelata]